MVLGFIFRNPSDAKKRPTRQSSSAHRRRHSVHGHRRRGQDQETAFYRARNVYEQEEGEIMRNELRKRDQNDRECKREMAMLERNKDAELKAQENTYLRRRADIMMRYRSGKISDRELEKQQQKTEEHYYEQMRSSLKKHRAAQAKAQRIFFSRGEEIGAETGAALRRAKAKMERTQRMSM